MGKTIKNHPQITNLMGGMFTISKWVVYVYGIVLPTLIIHLRSRPRHRYCSWTSTTTPSVVSRARTHLCATVCLAGNEFHWDWDWDPYGDMDTSLF